MEKRSPKSKHKKNPLQPNPDGLKPKANKWKKKLQIKQEKKSIIALNRRTKTTGNKMKKEDPNKKTKKIHHSVVEGTNVITGHKCNKGHKCNNIWSQM